MENQQSWDDMRNRVRDRDLTCATGTTTIPGTLAIEFALRDWSLPVGFIWYRWEDGGQLSIQYIWTHEELRRCGLGTYMFETLNNMYKNGYGLKVITTGRASNKITENWLLKNKFKFNERRNCWEKK